MKVNIAAENQWLEDLLILLSFWGYVSFLGAVKHHKKAKTKNISCIITLPTFNYALNNKCWLENRSSPCGTRVTNFRELTVFAVKRSGVLNQTDELNIRINIIDSLSEWKPESLKFELYFP